MNHRPIDIDGVVAAGRAQRATTARSRTRLSIGVSIAVLVSWLAYVTASGQWERVGDHWASALTMVFGSLVAGSTPQGGGAVAFPVFTKLLDIEPAVARSFSLCIQAVGMTAASLSIVIGRRAVNWRAFAIAAPAAATSFVLSAVLLGRSDLPFWPSRLPGAYVKVTFTLIVAAMAIVVYLGYRVQILERRESLTLSGFRVTAAIAVAGVLGGLASSLTGSGADVLLYLAVVVVIGVSPSVGVPTTVLVMTVVSIVGFVLYGIIDGQLSIDLTNNSVTAIGGSAVSTVDGAPVFATGPGLDSSQYDLFGLWLAATPVVAFGAPLGSWLSSLATDRQLVRFVIGLALLETVSTVAFLKGLVDAPDPALITYTVVGAAVVVAGLWALKAHGRELLGLPTLDTDESFTRDRLDMGQDFRGQLDQPDTTKEKP